MPNFSRFTRAAALGLVLVAAAPLAAQDQPASRPASTWSHDRSGLTVPATLAGFTRGESKQFDEDGYNVSVKFQDDASRSWATLFIYRASPASVPMWGDRAAAALLRSGAQIVIDPAAVTRSSFTPSGGAGEMSGMKLVALATGGASSTGLAIYLHDDWLVKLRMSSETLDPAALEARLGAFLEALALPAARRAAPPFAAIADCAAPAKPGKKAKLVQLDMMGSILLGGILGSAHDERLEKQKAAAEKGAPVGAASESPWCRDAASQPEYGVYRAGSNEEYLVAFGDSGTSLTVARYDMAGLIRPARGFLVTQSDGVMELVYPPFDRMPLPEQVLGLPGNVSPVFSAGLLPDSKDKTISVPSM